MTSFDDCFSSSRSRALGTRVKAGVRNGVRATAAVLEKSAGKRGTCVRFRPRFEAIGNDVG
jgi:hypothetical protein